MPNSQTGPVIESKLEKDMKELKMGSSLLDIKNLSRESIHKDLNRHMNKSEDKILQKSSVSLNQQNDAKLKLKAHHASDHDIPEEGFGQDREVSTSYTESLDNIIQQSAIKVKQVQEEQKQRLAKLKEKQNSKELLNTTTPKDIPNHDIQIEIPAFTGFTQVEEYDDVEPAVTGHKFESLNFIQYRSNEILYEQQKKPAKTIGRYILGDTLGEGSYGKVKEGFAIDTLQRVAVKIMKHAKLKKIPGGEQNVKREIAIQKRLRHKHIVQLLDVIVKEEKKKIYMIFEYCAGALQDVMERSPIGKLPASQCQRQIVRGLQYLHSNSIIHRDIKPGNILLTFDEVIKISDFGEVSRYDPNPMCTTSQGSPAFQPPEVAAGKPKFCPFSADIWAIGVTLYFLISGKYPFDGESIYVLFENIAKADYIMPEEADEILRTLIRGILEKDPERRLSLSAIESHAWLKAQLAKDFNEVPVIPPDLTNDLLSPVSADVQGSEPQTPVTPKRRFSLLPSHGSNHSLASQSSPMSTRQPNIFKPYNNPISNPHFANDTTLIPYLEDMFEDLKQTTKRTSSIDISKSANRMPLGEANPKNRFLSRIRSPSETESNSPSKTSRRTSVFAFHSNRDKNCKMQ